jgi:hypothetical protein
MGYLVAAYFIGIAILFMRAVYLGQKFRHYLKMHHPEKVGDFFSWRAHYGIRRYKTDDINDPEFNRLHKRVTYAAAVLLLWFSIPAFLGIMLALFLWVLSWLVP